MTIVRYIAAAASALIAAACGGSVTGTPQNVATFTVQVGSEQFAVRVTDQTTFEHLSARMQSGTTGVILGRVGAGNGGFNGPWSWHLVPGTRSRSPTSRSSCAMERRRISRRIETSGSEQCGTIARGARRS